MASAPERWFGIGEALLTLRDFMDGGLFLLRGIP
jgi:hypothetical protein